MCVLSSWRAGEERGGERVDTLKRKEHKTTTGHKGQDSHAANLGNHLRLVDSPPLLAE